MSSPGIDFDRFEAGASDDGSFALAPSARGAHYRVLPRRLGQGSYGTVYLGESYSQRGLRQEVAIKFPRGDQRAAWGLSDAGREYERSRRRGAHVVQAIDHSPDSSDTPYIVFELIHGMTLAEMVHKQQLSWGLVVKLVECLGSAMENFICFDDKPRQMFHGDLCPTNVMWDETHDRFVVIDLGRGHTAQTHSELVIEDGTFRVPETLNPSLQRDSGLPVPDIGNYIDLHMAAQTLVFGLTGHMFTGPSSTPEELDALPGDARALLRSENENTKHILEDVSQLLAAMLAPDVLDRSRGVPLEDVADCFADCAKQLSQIAAISYQVTDTWRLDSRQAIDARSSLVECAEYSPAGDFLAVGGLGVIRIVDTSTGSVTGRLTGHKSSTIHAMAWSPDGTKLVAAGQADTWVWDVVAGRRLQRLQGDLPSHGVMWNSAGLIVCGVDDCLMTWDFVRKVGHEGVGLGYVQVVKSIDVFSQRWLVLEASGGADQYARIWNAYTNAQEATIDLGAKGTVSGVVAGDVVCLAKETGGVSTWRLSLDKNGKVAVAKLGQWISSTPRGDTYSNKTVVALSPNGKVVAYAHTPPPGSSGLLEFWNLKGEQVAQSIALDGEIRSLAWSSRNEIACVMNDGTVHIVRERYVQEPRTKAPAISGTQERPRYSFTLLPDIYMNPMNRFIDATQSVPLELPGGGRSTSWSGMQIATPRGLYLRDSPTAADFRSLLFEEDLPSRTLQFSADGMSMLAVDEEEIVVLDMQAGAVSRIGRSQAAGSAACFDPTASYIATGGVDGQIHILSLEEETHRGVRQKHQLRDDRFNSVAWSQRNYLAAAAANEIALWRFPAGDPEVLESATKEKITSMVWSPEGESLLVSDAGGNCQIWNLALGGSRSITFQEHTSSVTALSWSPDSQVCATGDSTGAIFIWRSAVGAFSGFIQVFEVPVGSISWTPDQSQLLVADVWGTQAVLIQSAP